MGEIAVPGLPFAPLIGVATISAAASASRTPGRITSAARNIAASAIAAFSHEGYLQIGFDHPDPVYRLGTLHYSLLWVAWSRIYPGLAQTA